MRRSDPRRAAPLVCLHGFMDTVQTWDAVRPMLSRTREVVTPALAGHAGGPRITGAITDTTVADALEQTLDAFGIEEAHFAGNSLGGFTALQMAVRGRALSVVALAPAGGWARGDDLPEHLFEYQERIRAAGYTNAPGARAMLEHARVGRWELEAERIACPVRIIWGTRDELLPWPRAAHRYRHEWLPQADWVVLDDVGHYPQIERPLETAQLIAGFS